MGLPVNLIVELDQKLSRRHAAEVLRAVRCMATSRTAPGQRPTPHERGVVIELQMAPIEAADGNCAGSPFAGDPRPRLAGGLTPYRDQQGGG
jgi:hypothetical protein